MDSLVDQRFSDRVDQAAQLHINNTLEECIQVIDKALAEVRSSIDELQSALQNEAPQPCDGEAAVMGMNAENHAEVAVKKVEHQAESRVKPRFTAEQIKQYSEEAEAISKTILAWMQNTTVEKAIMPSKVEVAQPVILRSFQGYSGFIAEHMPTPPTRKLRTGLTPGYVPLIHRTHKNSERTEGIPRKKPSWRRDK
nr:hypothetical protein B0A51_09768 [Rachicladosporium sp. CCFEE 5018]